jgi:3-deoxy-D-manno-octulosonic-acid transferase
MTVTGLQTAQEAFGAQAAVSLIPLDSKLFLRRVFNRISPRLVLVFETELWPQFLALSKASGATIVLVNGRISARSFPRYQKIRGFVQALLVNFDHFLMSGEDSASRIRELGAPASKVRVLGNVKWAGNEAAAQAREVPGWGSNMPVLLAASTHPGEEEQVLDAYEDLLQYQPDTKLLLAPRHPQRVPEVLALLKARKLTHVTRTSRADASAAKVFVLDTVGELRSFFPLARVVYSGGSLVDIGGHNVLEPAGAGVPVVYGPHMANFAEIADALEKRGGATRVADWRALAQVLRDLFPDEARRHKMGAAGKRLVAENQRILDSYVNALRPILGKVEKV